MIWEGRMQRDVRNSRIVEKKGNAPSGKYRSCFLWAQLQRQMGDLVSDASESPFPFFLSSPNARVLFTKRPGSQKPRDKP